MAVRVGFIGCGGMANAHFNSLSQLDNVERVAFCDVNLDRAKQATEKFGGKAYSDHRTMLDAEKPDAVYIVVPPGFHDDIEVDVANRKIPFFIEKPVEYISLSTTSRAPRAAAAATMGASRAKFSSGRSHTMSCWMAATFTTTLS